MGQAHFLENIYTGENTFLFIFMNYFFTLDTICADNKDKPMAGCKNQLIEKVFEKFIAANICHIKFIFQVIKFTTVNILG